jgi:HD-like signal output (HDOD) protein
MSSELALLGEILNLAGSPDASLDDFGAKVATSPQLAAEVVRVSNSALYGMEGRINRLERALLILGMRTVGEIASALLVAKKMKGMNIGELSGDALWMHSLEIGVCAQLIARCLSLPLESECYLAGLLHDLGVVGLYEAHGEKYADLVVRCHNDRTPLVLGEQETLNETHGTHLLNAAAEWGFPEVLRQTIGYHDTPADAPESCRVLATLIRAAHIVVTEPSNGWTDVPPTDEDEQILTDLDLSADDASDIQALMEDQIKEIAPLFS